MTEPQYATLVFMPLIVAIVAAAIAWRRLARPWLFLVASVLALLGVQAIAAPAAVGYFLSSASASGASAGFDRSLVVSAVLVVALGTPFMWWLSRGLRKP